MSSIFISYSRKDLAIAEKLVSALAESDLDTWIDWKNIPKGEKFEQEIYEGIEQANIFLFLISPESVKSEWCKKEITHAIKNNKRIIPILLQDTNQDLIPSGISERNWIFYHEHKDNFSVAIEEILKTIHADYEWVKYQTKLQVKTLEWERRKDNSRLLRGKELHEAEQQLVNAGSKKDPQPTDQQRLYVLESRRDDIRRRRQVTIGLTISFMLMSVLCIISITSSFLANSRENARATAQTNAEEQANIALARQLAAQAQLILSKEDDANVPLIASLLAIESVQLYPNAEADQIMREGSSLLLVPKQTNLMKHTDTINSMDFSADGKQLISGGDDDTVRIWDVETGNKIKEFKLNGDILLVRYHPRNNRLSTVSKDGMACTWDIQTHNEVICVHIGEGFTAVNFSLDGTLLVSGGADGIARAWSMETGEELASLVHEGKVVAIAINSNSNYVATSGDENIIKVWNPKTGNEIIQRSTNIFAQYSIDFNPEGNWILSGGDDGLVVWDVQTGETITNISPEVDHVGFFSPDGKLVTFHRSYNNMFANISSTESGELLTSIQLNFYVSSYSFSPNSKYLMTGSEDGSVRLWDVTTGAEIGRALQVSRSSPIVFSPSGNIIASAGDTINLWNMPLAHSTILQPNGMNVKINVDSGGRWLALWDQDGTSVEILEILTNTTKTVIDQANPIYLVDFSPDGKLVALVTTNGTACIWTIPTGQRVICRHQGDSVHSIKFSPDSKLIVSTEGKTIQIWNTKTGSEVFKLSRDSGISFFAFSPDSKWIAFTMGDKIELWDFTSQQIIKEFQHDPTVLIGDLIFSPDGKWLISSSMDSTARVWNLETMKEVSRLTYTPEEFINMYEVLKTRVSPNGERLLSVNTVAIFNIYFNAITPRESTIRVWDLLSGQEINRVIHDSWVDDIIWSTDEKYFFSGGRDGAVRMWSTLSGDEIARIIHNAPIESLTLTRDGKQILSVSSDGVYKFSFWLPEDTITQACTHLNRNLSLSEWKKYFGNRQYHATCPNLSMPTQ